MTEPLDPKAELMRLARECGDIERRHCIGKAQGFDVRDAYIALESAITLALAAERRRAIVLAANHLNTERVDGTVSKEDAAYNRAIDHCQYALAGLAVDGKAGGT